MDEEKRNSARKGRSYNEEHAGTVFCEELLFCCVCRKIYFSKQPIALPTRSRKSFHVCLACSRTLSCSICRKPVSPVNILVVEDLPNSAKGLLCPRCRSKFLGGDQTAPRNGLRRLYASAASTLNTFLKRVRKLMSVEIFPRG